MPSKHFFRLIFFFLVLIALLIGAIQDAYEKIGINRRYVFALLLLSLLGSYVNIPIAELPAERVLSNQEIPLFGMGNVIPEVEEWHRTVIAINLGGAVIPTLLSVYLLLENGMVGRVH